MLLNANIEEMIQEIAKNIKSTAFFYGTGLSIDSGCLDVGSIKTAIMEAFKENLGDSARQKLDDKTIKYVADNTYQFEDFMMRLFDDLNKNIKYEFFNKLFKILYNNDYYKPNAYHDFLADLFKKDMISCIATTNFDLLLENAYGENFDREVVIKSFNKVMNNRTAKVSKKYYYKLHGCINDHKNIIATLLTGVASEDSKKKIRNNLEEILNKVNSIIFVGYSFSDVFDIVEELKQILGNGNYKSTKIYIIAYYDPKCDYNLEGSIYTPNEWNELFDKKYEMPVKRIDMAGCDIKIIWYDTNEFIKGLKERLDIKIDIDNKEEHKVADKVNNYSKLKDNLKCLFSEYFNNNKFMYHFPWRFCLECGENYSIHKCRNKEHFNKNNSIMKKALEDAKYFCNLIESKYPNEKSINKKHKAQIYIAEGDYEKAKEILDDLCKELDSKGYKGWLYFEAVRRLYEIDYQKMLCGTIQNMDEHEHKRYIRDLEKLMDDTYTYKLIKHKIMMIYYAIKINNVILNNNQGYSKDKILKALINANEFYEKAGRMEYLSYVYLEMARYYKLNGDDENFNKYNKEAIKIFQALGGDNSVMKKIAEELYSIK